MAQLNTQFKRRGIRATLRDFSRTHPKTAALLLKAQSNREQHLSQYFNGARLKGLEELLQHLEELEGVYKRSSKLRPIAFLVRRAQGDFETALETTLSGFATVAHDAMRDVMEIEFLLRDFYYEPDHIVEWLTCNSKERLNRFSPAILRNRQARRLGKLAKDVPEATDYRAHSMFLHVSPHQNPFGDRGLSASSVVFGDACFCEIFEHARRFLLAAHRLRRKLARHLKSPSGPERGLKKVRDAWERTQQLQVIWLTLLDAARVRSDDEAPADDPPQH